MNATVSYQRAVEKYLDALTETRVIPSQSSKSLSTRWRRSWRLRNTNGLLATVADNGEVLLSEEVER